MNNKKIKRITFIGLMTACAIVLSFVESLFPVLAFMPPGAKLGLSNIAVMFGAYALSFWEVMIIVIAKAVFALITRGFTAFLMSLVGGILSGIAMYILFKKINGIGCLGIGVVSALFHNIGQLLVSFLLLKTKAVLGYAPILILMGVLTGVLTGILLKITMPYFDKMKILKEMEK